MHLIAGLREQRATLGIEDRTELEDLVERLSAEPAVPESQTATPDGQVIALGGTEARTLRANTKTNRVEIDYAIDHGSRRIRITHVQQRVGGPEPSAERS